jgi:CPA1 family monovalent cation:H+ antiporter
MPTGAAFPARDLAIVLAMGVILVSLVIATAALPVLARGLKLDPAVAKSREDEETTARTATAAAAVRRIQEICGRSDALPELRHHRSAVTQLIDVYRGRLDDRGATGQNAGDEKEAAAVLRWLRLEALRAERDELYRMSLSREIDETLHRKLLREIDLYEAALSEELRGYSD